MWTVRPEEPADIPAIRRVEAAAFGRDDEANLVDALREAGALTLSLVAEMDGRIVGHLVFSPATVSEDGHTWNALALGPLAVAPEWQGRGVGGALMRAGLNGATALGATAIFLIGHPSYYPRFGFEPAGSRGFTCDFPVPDDVFMVAELQPGALADRVGHMRFRPEFDGV